MSNIDDEHLEHTNVHLSHCCVVCGCKYNDPLCPVQEHSDIFCEECTAHAPGAKLDSEKPRMSLVLDGFANALLEVGKVGTFGARKYSDNGWKQVPNGLERYKNAQYRHMLSQGADDETGFLHAAHAAWNALALLELMLKEKA